MPLYSMTGFGRGSANDDKYTVTVEIKSVNHRFKDFRFRMPQTLSSQELHYRKLLKENFARGSFDISINLEKGQSEQGIDNLDGAKIRGLIEFLKSELGDDQDRIQIRPGDFLRPEFALPMSDDQEERVFGLTEKAFEQAIGRLLEARESEGSKLQKNLSEYLGAYRKNFETLAPRAEHYKANVEERLKNAIKSYGAEIEEGRLMQEVIYYLEKLDVQEEFDRIGAHLSKLDKLLGQGPEVGRQIDFMLQELGRETNTIGSKSQDREISESVVQMKVCLEKMREQALNLQ